MEDTLKPGSHPVARETETVGNLTARDGRLRVFGKVAKAIHDRHLSPLQTDRAKRAIAVTAGRDRRI